MSSSRPRRRPRPFAFHKQRDPSTEGLSPEVDAPESAFSGEPLSAPDLHAEVDSWRVNSLPKAREVINSLHSKRENAGTAFRSLRVFARVRPVLESLMAETNTAPSYETTTAVTPFLFFHTPEERLGLPTGRLLSTPQKFDGVFGSEESDQSVFEHTVAPLVESAMDYGARVMAIAFGQTGSGKTHTSRHWIEKTLRKLFSAKRQNIKISLEYYEIRGSKVLDLLQSRSPCELKVDGNGDVHVKGVRSVACATLKEAMETIGQGIALRATKSTKSNSQSSRSHAVCVFNLAEGGDGVEGGGRVQLVDLAGSERSRDATTHTSELITELQEINSSLGALKAAIRAMYLRDVCKMQSTHVNYRASKLTLLLKEMFECPATSAEMSRPPSSCVFLACFAPLDSQIEHTLSTAKYCRQLLAVAATRDGTRDATPEELQEGLQLFYLDTCPERASNEMVSKVLDSFRGREAKLHRGLKKKYGRAPAVLLRAPRAKGVPVPPIEWSKGKTMKWVKGLHDGKLSKYSAMFRISGSQLFGLSVHDCIRRCGGSSSCAAFNTPDHVLNDLAPSGTPDVSKEDDEAAEVKSESEAYGADEAGREIFEAFRLEVKKSKYTDQ